MWHMRDPWGRKHGGGHPAGLTQYRPTSSATQSHTANKSLFLRTTLFFCAQNLQLCTKGKLKPSQGKAKIMKMVEKRIC